MLNWGKNQIIESLSDRRRFQLARAKQTDIKYSSIAERNAAKTSNRRRTIFRKSNHNLNSADGSSENRFAFIQFGSVRFGFSFHFSIQLSVGGRSSAHIAEPGGGGDLFEFFTFFVCSAGNSLYSNKYNKINACMQNTMGEKKTTTRPAHCRGELVWCTEKNNAQKSEFIYRIDLNGYIRSYLSQTQH